MDGRVVHVGDAAAQTAQALRIGLDALAEVGAEPGDVVRTRMYVTDRLHADEVGRAHNVVFGAVRPAATWCWWPVCWIRSTWSRWSWRRTSAIAEDAPGGLLAGLRPDKLCTT
ncbi:Rid family hydrolase [Micromonospora sp. M12]